MKTEVKALEVISDDKPSPALVYLAKLNSMDSRRTQKNALDVIARKLGAVDAFGFNWAMLDYEHIVAIQSWLLATRKPATARRYIAAVRGVLKAAWRMGQINTDSYMRRVDLDRMEGDSKIGRMATDEEVNRLLDTCRVGPPTRGIRDEAILRLMFALGLRVAEVIDLKYSDFDQKTGALNVHGKGRKLRDVYMANGTKAALAAWLELRGTHPGALFETITRGDEIDHKGIASTLSLWEMFTKRCDRAGIPHTAPHDARRTACSNLLNQTDALTTAKLLGHSSTSMTLRYDLRGENEKKLACEKVGMPFTPREDEL